MPADVPLHPQSGAPLIGVQQCDRQDGERWWEVYDRRPITIKQLHGPFGTREEADEFVRNLT